MEEQKLREALRALFAYDTGTTDSGIKNEVLRQKCLAAIEAMPRTPFEVVPRLWLSRLIRDCFLSEEALAQGYGIEDALTFLRWMEDVMGMPGL